MLRNVVTGPVLLLLTSFTLSAAQIPQNPLAAESIPQFAQPLPRLSIAPQNGTLQTLAGNRPLTLRMCEFRSRVLPDGAVNGYAGTWTWGYLPDPTGTSACASLIALYGTDGTLDTYIGPVIVNQRGTPTAVTWINDLGSAAATNVLAYRNSTDKTIHWADPDDDGCAMEEVPPAFGSPCAANYLGSVPAVAHLHGGEVPPQIDGGPLAWFTSNGAKHGSSYYTFGSTAANAARYIYPNVQEAAPLWFHDHTLGATRLNVYAGLAGAYLIDDPALSLPSNLTPLNQIIPLVLQDRSFDENGQLLFQAGLTGGTLWALNPNHPYWSPEFVGDAIVVNGKAWPYLDVEARRYRFLILNGSNARTYELTLPGTDIWVIGSDGGYLDAPVRVPQRLLVMPGERYDVLIDFAAYTPGTHVTLRNTGRTPYPSGEPPHGETLGRILELRVRAATSPDTSFDPESDLPLRTGTQKIVRITGTTPTLTRLLTLNEAALDPSTAVNPITGETTDYEGGPLEILVNNTPWHGALSEQPAEGTTEVWELVNLTADAHPIHLHLVQFQLISRQPFRGKYFDAYAAAFPNGEYKPEFGPPLDYRADQNPQSGGKFGGNPDVAPYLFSKPQPPGRHESGWKDTIVAPPGMVTRIAVRWAPTDLTTLFYPFNPSGGSYVWHCHIIDHEDNEMMRRFEVTPSAGATRTLKLGIDY